MKLVTLRTRGGSGTAAARLDGETLTEIPGQADVGALLANENWREIARNATGSRHRLAEAELETVVPHPSKVLCAGLNYTSHIQEMGRDLPSYPTLFAKFADTLTGPTDSVAAVPEDPEMDWEGELGVIIGRTAYKVSEDEAEDCIAGFTVANDISMRGWQYRTTEWLQGKIWARSTPVGPFLVTPDEFDPATAVLRTTVNGAPVQEHGIADLLFTPAHLVAYVSTILPLHPGDLILTGTPGGVGRARTPRVYLTAGDVVAVTIDGIGSLSTPIV
ncbi:fumarylacetoacetate hydrolase family protein [Streptomyces laculatispora]|uniref:fumarylacetoacetate hydrolase family protein n=1 Tax=Streptomyces laculatispora TaxID=887464 RepID=UPI001A946FCA|nr:fumarylacetoacetate hydrolase family protein [Streptomyces laculatispora]MBO0913120.1 fumarylacetoacetate hydrolase family protein [Streptomyces laculatispora]